jgi:uncharacterized membrane protein YedE/YeeE
MKRFVFIFFGALFGFCLSRARATDYDAILGMFRLTDLHLFGVIGVAIATAGLGLLVLRKIGVHSLGGEPIRLAPKPMHASVFTGGLIFGVGWALSGACPGTALAQLGEGKLYALATVAGIVAGTWLKLHSGASASSTSKIAGAR